MKENLVNDKISYIEASENPLSADIGIIKEDKIVWLYDVGNGDKSISDLNGSYNVVLSHFHADHIGNIGKIHINELYLSKETCRHIPKEVAENCKIHIVTEPVKIGNLNIFPLPSSHAKGSLGLEVDENYTFVGDALYCRFKNNSCTYNVQFLKEEIELLKSLSSPYLLVSHYKGFVRKKADVILELETIYAKRTKGCSEILIEK